MNLLRILLRTYGSGEVELMEEGITSSGGMVGTGARGEVDSWCGGNVGGWQWATEVGSGRCCSSVLKTVFYINNKHLKSIMFSACIYELLNRTYQPSTLALKTFK